MYSNYSNYILSNIHMKSSKYKNLLLRDTKLEFVEPAFEIRVLPSKS